MTYTTTHTETSTFTHTHAVHIAAKVATDLKRMQRFYGMPSDSDIADYKNEVIELMKTDCLGTVIYGFRRNKNWVEPTLRYTAQDLTVSASNDNDPGRVRPGAIVDGASFGSYLTYSENWHRLNGQQKNAILDLLPIKRTSAPAPGSSGNWVNDLNYSAGGRALHRSSLKGA